VTSKKIGIAVVRNSARRRMRAIFLSYQNILLSGKYIFVIKNSINNRSFDELKKDFDFAFNRMRLINS
jgi:ribonuclease P protein component